MRHTLVTLLAFGLLVTAIALGTVLFQRQRRRKRNRWRRYFKQ